MRALILAALSLLVLFSLGLPTAGQLTISPTPQLAALSGVRAFFITLRSDGPCKVDQFTIAAGAEKILGAANIKVVDRFDSSFPDLPIMEVSIDAFNAASRGCMWWGKILVRANTTSAEVDGSHYFEYQPIWQSQFKSAPRSPEGFTEDLSDTFEVQLRLLLADIETAKRMFPDL